MTGVQTCALPILIIVGIICTVSRKGIITAWLVLFLYFTLNKEAKKIFVLSIATVVAVAILSLTTLVSQRFTEEKIGSQFAGKQVLVSAGVDMFLKTLYLGWVIRVTLKIIISTSRDDIFLSQRNTMHIICILLYW